MGGEPCEEDRRQEMKILYFSDNYAHGVMGTKRSIFEELRRRGHTVVWKDKVEIGTILKQAEAYNPDQVWFAHSFLELPESLKKQAKVPFVGFGFSDPYGFKEEKLKGYDVYITNHRETYEYLKFKGSIPVHYNPTACDLSFHDDLGLKKDIDISVIGVGKHIRFKNQNERIEIVNYLRSMTPFRIEVYGNGWNKHTLNFGPIEGEKFLSVINRSKIGLDIQDVHSPLAHRMFEYSACGTPVITRDRPEVEGVFEPMSEILTYNTKYDLREKLNAYLGNLDKLAEVGQKAKERCIKDHNIDKRVDGILRFLERDNDP